MLILIAQWDCRTNLAHSHQSREMPILNLARGRKVVVDVGSAFGNMTTGHNLDTPCLADLRDKGYNRDTW